MVGLIPQTPFPPPYSPSLLSFTPQIPFVIPSLGLLARCLEELIYYSTENCDIVPEKLLVFTGSHESQNSSAYATAVVHVTVAADVIVEVHVVVV